MAGFQRRERYIVYKCKKPCRKETYATRVQLSFLVQKYSFFGTGVKEKIPDFEFYKSEKDRGRLTFLFAFPSPLDLLYLLTLFPYYFQFTGPLLLTIVGDTFVFASVEECRSVLKTYWLVVHSNLPVSCTVFCQFLWPDNRSQSERANSVIPWSPSLFLHITRRVI